MTPLITFLLVLLVLAAVWAVTVGELILAAIGLALTSAILACVLYAFNMPLAAVFELSVCAGLITVVFVSTISMTRPEGDKSAENIAAVKYGRAKNLWGLLGVVVVTVVVYALLPKNMNPAPPTADNSTVMDVARVMWDGRRWDLVGQIAAILTGVLGVVVLFKERTGKAGK